MESNRAARTSDSVSDLRLVWVGAQSQISRERVRQIENEALQKLRRLDGERLFAYHQEL